MVSAYREYFNRGFSKEKYTEFLRALVENYPPVSIRFAETPIFISEDFRDQLIAAGDEIIGFILQPDFKDLTAAAIPPEWQVPNENEHPHFMAFDFGVCKDESGRLVPKLIEMQGFASLYAFQVHMADTYKKIFELDNINPFTPYFHGLTQEEYIGLLKKVILGPYAAEQVALMDLDAPNQKTAIDFYVTEKYLGIPVLSLTDIFQEGNRLFYENEGRKIRLKRIYNRLIFDEVSNKQELFSMSFDPREPLDIEWITHPNWFYRISKYTLPYLKGGFVPETFFLNELPAIPADLENYVLKPLFSFAGHGVIIDVTTADIAAITNPEQWIIQRKVIYEPVIKTPEGWVKAEIRLLYLWPDGEQPQLCINLARLSRGKMIGVRYNSEFDWVGGTIGLMDK